MTDFDSLRWIMIYVRHLSQLSPLEPSWHNVLQLYAEFKRTEPLEAIALRLFGFAHTMDDCEKLCAATFGNMNVAAMRFDSMRGERI
jgi:hypothetical protein